MDLLYFIRLQFPTGRASGLDEAVELALSGERITNSSATSLQQVITAVSTYRALQKEICNAKDMVNGKFGILVCEISSLRMLFKYM